ncbi:MAG: hypothetical protein RBR32_12465 [Bacteroidales bacterium]|nr:hypothetical protein [Bacteroidales bacterium]
MIKKINLNGIKNRLKLNILQFLILGIILSFAFTFTFCGKTDTDLEWETKILGFWTPTGNDNNPLFDMPNYKFEKEGRGISFLSSVQKADSFSWEIKRTELKIYYDNAPSYYIGYDKYNSRSLFKIKSVNDTSFYVIQYFGTGYQKEYFMKKAYFVDDTDDWDDVF